MSSRQHVLDQIIKTIEKAARNRTIILGNAEARRIFGMIPDSPMSILEIRTELTHRSSERRLPIDLSDHA